MKTFSNVYDLLQPSLFSKYSVKLGRECKDFETETEAIAAIFHYQTQSLINSLELFISRSNLGKKEPGTVFSAFKPFTASLQSFRAFIAFKKNVKSREILDRLQEDLLPSFRMVNNGRLHKYQFENWKNHLEMITDYQMYWESFKIRKTATA